MTVPGTHMRGSPNKRLLVYIFWPKHLSNPAKRLWGQIVVIFGKYKSIPSHRKNVGKIRRRKKCFFSLWNFGFGIFPSFLKDFLITIGAYKRILREWRENPESETSEWEKIFFLRRIFSIFFLWLGMDLYLLKIATIWPQSRRYGEAKCLGPKRYTNNFFWRAPHVEF